MTAADANGAVLVGRDIRRSFRRNKKETVVALDTVSLTVERGALTALVGPDGAGKTTLIRLAAGLMAPDSGELSVLGFDVVREPQQIQDRVGYMPQRFGLYEDLSVQENIDLYADLHGVRAEDRAARFPKLMEMTALGSFTKRLAGQLSGGMKQKLGLACALVHAPELLLLDEPTVGVDPLSRHELWQIILALVKDQHTSALISTSYLDEADYCGHVLVLHEGKVLAQGPPVSVSKLADGRVFVVDPPEGHAARGLQARLLDDPAIVDAVPEGGRVRFVRARGIEDGTVIGPLRGLKSVPVPVRFEDGFMTLLRDLEPAKPAIAAVVVQPPERHGDDVAVEVDNLVRIFGKFTAVDHVGFKVRRGELFGLLGPNGAGKTTTFRMLCGLLPVTSGTLRVAGLDVRKARAPARQRIGYVAQKFSLYGELSAVENLEFFASAYGLGGERRRQRIDWALKQFDLDSLRDLASGELPGGYKQRLAMAAALLHEPEILFLDEPTSGADPLARRGFWRRITALAEQGVTVIITTHFMEEAEYCDRVAIMDEGRILAQGTPAEMRQLAPKQAEHEATMEDAFIAIVGEARHKESSKPVQGVA